MNRILQEVKKKTVNHRHRYCRKSRTKREPTRFDGVNQMKENTKLHKNEDHNYKFTQNFYSVQLK